MGFRSLESKLDVCFKRYAIFRFAKCDQHCELIVAELDAVFQFSWQLLSNRQIAYKLAPKVDFSDEN